VSQKQFHTVHTICIHSFNKSHIELTWRVRETESNKANEGEWHNPDGKQKKKHCKPKWEQCSVHNHRKLITFPDRSFLFLTFLL